ncbi:MAG: Bifunctional deaminase-reductase domain protein [Candidatus Uhrbacteria bacterium GW2011_GWE2_40_58]|nr:MAG: Bifunctional deaminase-reductase domain protein [Candidatus Uhrbacteria bacterium GW2011_GWF2_40_263]KKR68038.1 MAG: Bifunctional deaminase-reductase domain protein [Candidatus Uhrbacteria bacterium GW2011_GWE2_40_58]OGL92927.1 MAG: hypothetical protein A2239_04215 [Candidatus Uhrbacteria bacterium RIFOXYA2_FULL_40_9]OGL97065.1 MAG: hypothetical protein A2332_04220 [Candidatus Uhrbacteria bacterium RIFOXYB2_FULL_41_18]HBK34627.1 dihydrofolate reductase [Candidatus Uhrbacteria bacterium]
MKVILLAAISVDGKIAQSREQNSTDWTSKEDVRFFVEKSKEIGALIMGETTYQTIGRPLKDRTIYVLTKNPDSQVSKKGIVFTGGLLQDVLKQVEKDGFSSVLIAGGASVYSQFLKEGLVNELFLTVEPYLFGQGIPLLTDCPFFSLEFVSVKPLNQQTLLLHYRIPSV